MAVTRNRTLCAAVWLAVYQYVEAVAGGILLTELTVLGTVDAKIVVGDLLFA